MTYDHLIHDCYWICADCKETGKGGHPQAKAHRKKTGHHVIVNQHFEYHYLGEGG